MKKALPILAGLVLVIGAFQAFAAPNGKAPVIEVATLKIKAGVTTEQFSAVDHKLETDYISKRPGFLARESAPGSKNTWLVIVHWRSLADAEASMNSFESAPGSSQFMSMVEPGSMIMTRYGR